MLHALALGGEAGAAIERVHGAVELPPLKFPWCFSRGLRVTVGTAMVDN